MPSKLKSATIWPLMGIHAQDTKHAGAWRLHVLASTLDHGEQCDHANNICSGGSGKIQRATLEAQAFTLGVKRSTFFYWLADARRAGILNGEGDYLSITSQDKLSKILLCNSIDERKAIIPIKLLFKPGWKSVVWAAYNKANHNKKIISMVKLEALTGVKERAQRRHNNFVKRTRNIAITTTDGDMLDAAKEHGPHKGNFVFVDAQQKNRRVLAYAIPARRSVNDTHAKIGAAGRRRVIAKAIQREKENGLLNIGNYPQARPQQANNGKTTARLFHETKKQIKKAGKFTQALHRAPGDPMEIFVTRGRKFSIGAWDAFPVGVNG